MNCVRKSASAKPVNHNMTQPVHLQKNVLLLFPVLPMYRFNGNIYLTFLVISIKFFTQKLNIIHSKSYKKLTS